MIGGLTSLTTLTIGRDWERTGSAQRALERVRKRTFPLSGYIRQLNHFPGSFLAVSRPKAPQHRPPPPRHVSVTYVTTG